VADALPVILALLSSLLEAVAVLRLDVLRDSDPLTVGDGIRVLVLDKSIVSEFVQDGVSAADIDCVGVSLRVNDGLRDLLSDGDVDSVSDRVDDNCWVRLLVRRGDTVAVPECTLVGVELRDAVRASCVRDRVPERVLVRNPVYDGDAVGVAVNVDVTVGSGVTVYENDNDLFSVTECDGLVMDTSIETVCRALRVGLKICDAVCIGDCVEVISYESVLDDRTVGDGVRVGVKGLD